MKISTLSCGCMIGVRSIVYCKVHAFHLGKKLASLTRLVYTYSLFHHMLLLLFSSVELYGLIQKPTHRAGSWTQRKDQGGWGEDSRDVISSYPRSSSYRTNKPNTERFAVDLWLISLTAAHSLKAHQNSRGDCRWTKRSGKVQLDSDTLQICLLGYAIWRFSCRDLFN